MSYQDILEEGLVRLRNGESVESVLLAYPDHAIELERDLTAALAARSVASALPAVSEASRQHLRNAVRDVRIAREHRASGRIRWLSLGVPAAALAGLVAVAIALAAMSGVFQANTAEASIEGVVIEVADGQMTVQTDSGLETIQYEPALQLTDESGAQVAAGSVEPGQLVTVRGERRAGQLRAERIQLRANERLEAWCEQFSTPCTAIERVLAQRAAACTADAAQCRNVHTRLELLRKTITASPRIASLQQRCEAGTAQACEDLQRACEAVPAACESIREWLRNRRLR